VTSGRSKERFLDAWLLESECIYHMSPKKEWFSTTSLLKEDNPDENDAACTTIRISSIRMKIFRTSANTQGRETRFRPWDKTSLVGALEAQGSKFSCTDGALKVIKGSMIVLKVERTTNLYKEIGSVVIDDASIATKNDNTIRL